MSIPYETSPIVIEVEGGRCAIVEVLLPSRCYIKRYTLAQVAGDPGNADLNLFNLKTAAQDWASWYNDSPHSLNDGDAELNDELFIVWHHAGSMPIEYQFTNEGILFFSHDDAPGRQGQKMRSLHVTVAPEGTGPKTFQFILGVSVPDLR
jgi:hypothetical protein